METTPLIQETWSKVQARQSLQRTGEWIKQFGSRMAGSTGCHETGAALQHELERICGNARLEPFITRPAAFGRFYQVDFVIYAVGVILLLFNQPLPAARTLLKWRGLVYAPRL